MTALHCQYPCYVHCYRQFLKSPSGAALDFSLGSVMSLATMISPSVRQGTRDLKTPGPHSPFYHLSSDTNRVIHHNIVLRHCNREDLKVSVTPCGIVACKVLIYCLSGDPQFVQLAITTSFFSVAISSPNRTLLDLVSSSAMTLTSSCVSCIPLAPSPPIRIGKGPPLKVMMGICTTDVN